jgi:hypothetical protein
MNRGLVIWVISVLSGSLFAQVRLFLSEALAREGEESRFKPEESRRGLKSWRKR